MRKLNGQSLTLLLIFVAISMIIIAAVVIVSAVNLTSTSKYSLGEETYAVAEAGVEDAIVNVLRSPLYTGRTMSVGTYGSAIVTVTYSMQNYPVYVGITSDSSLSNFAQSDADDILFTDSDGTTKLNHEIESYSSGTGALNAFVKVPTVKPTGTTYFYMYFGNSTTSNQQNPTAVWDNYIGVWHLQETSGTQFDSTSNNHDIIAIGASIQGTATAMIGGADAFSGAVGNSGTVLDANTLKVTNQFTLETWAIAKTIPGINKYAAIVSGQTNPNYYIEFTETNKVDFGFLDRNNNDWYIATGSSAVSLNRYFYLAGTFDNTLNQMYLYINSTPLGSSVSVLGDPYTGPQKVLFGGSGWANENLRGHIDEVRISNIVRDQAYMTTTYNNISAPSSFISIGTTEKESGSVTWYNSLWSTRKKISINSSKTGNPVVTIISEGIVGYFRKKIKVTGTYTNGNFSILTWEEI